MFEVLPNETILRILGHTDLRTLSTLMCCNKKLYTLFNHNNFKWEVIDNLKNLENHVPRTRQTYEEYRYCVDFKTLLYNKVKIPEKVIETFEDLIDFSMLSAYQTLSETLVRKYHQRIDFLKLICHQKLPNDMLAEYLTLDMDPSRWYQICKHQKLDTISIEKYYDKINWHALSQNKEALTLEIILKYSEKLIWQEVTNLGLSEEVISMFLHKMDMFAWSNISYTSCLSSGFIRKYKDKLNIMALLTCQSLGEDVIEELIEYSGDTQYWLKVCTSQPISMQFIIKHIEKLSLHLLIRNAKIKKSHLKAIFG
jgi:hypothetical protein